MVASEINFKRKKILLPVNLLKLKSRILRRVRFPINEGIRPFSPSLIKLNISKPIRSPICLGISPAKSQWNINEYTVCGKLCGINLNENISRSKKLITFFLQ